MWFCVVFSLLFVTLRTVLSFSSSLHLPFSSYSFHQNPHACLSPGSARIEQKVNCLMLTMKLRPRHRGETSFVRPKPSRDSLAPLSKQISSTSPPHFLQASTSQSLHLFSCTTISLHLTALLPFFIAFLALFATLALLTTHCFSHLYASTFKHCLSPISSTFTLHFLHHIHIPTCIHLPTSSPLYDTSTSTPKRLHLHFS